MWRFHLRGTESNRDAIGARVTVELSPRAGSSPSPASPKLIQTIRAGDAFLSQSSKWLHFGLGSDTDVVTVEIRWPSGAVESFSNVRSGKRYEIVERSGQAVLLPPITRDIVLAPRRQKSVPSQALSRTFFSNRVPMPLVAYQPFDKQQEQSINVAGRPLLITLWASWCQPCLVELYKMGHDVESLRRAGLDVLALSVDGLDPNRPTTAIDRARRSNDWRFRLPAEWRRARCSTSSQLSNRSCSITSRDSLYPAPISSIHKVIWPLHTKVPSTWRSSKRMWHNSTCRPQVGEIWPRHCPAAGSAVLASC